jgi:hypothetical protein
MMVEKPQVPPLHYATVGMTILFGNGHSSIANQLFGNNSLDF